MSKTVVVQAEVRLASKDDPCAVLVVVWSADVSSNPLYLLRNSTPNTILCRQPLHDEAAGLDEDGNLIAFNGCAPDTTGDATKDADMDGYTAGGIECGADLGPIIKSFLGLDHPEEFVWVLHPGESICFGFDDPEKTHILEWTYVTDRVRRFGASTQRAFVEVDAMGTSSVLKLGGGSKARCQIRAEHSTKVIEFTAEIRSKRIGKDLFRQLRPTGKHFEELLGKSSARSVTNESTGSETTTEEDIVTCNLLTADMCSSGSSSSRVGQNN